jgi:hypothetical protein
MLSSSVSDVRQTKVYDISFRVPAIREGPLSASRSLGQKIKLLLTTKVNVDRRQPRDKFRLRSQNCDAP